MKALTIFYDPNCGLCRNFRNWLQQQDAYLPLHFVGFQTEEARSLFPAIATVQADKELVVIADDGCWWQGPAAWLTCLWALKKYREWSFRLATPSLLPIVASLCQKLSQNRLQISQLLRLDNQTLTALNASVEDEKSPSIPAAQ